MTSLSELIYDSVTLEIKQVGDKVLRQIARPVELEEIRSQAMSQLVRMIKSTMFNRAVGLAAPQVGVPLRLICIEVREERIRSGYSEEEMADREMEFTPFLALFNPTIEPITDELRVFREGCRSLDGFSAEVPRYRTIRVGAFDETGKAISFIASGWLARIIQHEVDHLEGTLYIDKADMTTMAAKSR